MTPVPGSPNIYDFEVWVTPFTRYIRMSGLSSLPMHISYPEEDYIQDADPQNYFETPSYLFDFAAKGADLVKQFEQLGHKVRLKEVSKPRFGEDQWMRTNRIKKGVNP